MNVIRAVTTISYRISLSVVLSSILVCLLTVRLTYPVFAQHAASLCVTTKVGSPDTPPTLPAGCGTGSGGGDYHNPLALPDQLDKLNTIIHAINTEMGSYPGEGFGGHIEHAGLDIMTGQGNHGPVYAITDGKVESIMNGSVVVDPASCPGIESGCTIRLIHDNDEFTSAYVHTDPAVKTGDVIKRGQEIARVHIWPGYTDMDHLHLELRLTVNNQNVNPRLYFPELEQFPIAPGYNGDVRVRSAQQGIYLEEGDTEWAKQFRDHPPCPNASPTYCWAL